MTDKCENVSKKMYEMLMHAKCTWGIEWKRHILLVIGHYSSYSWPSAEKKNDSAATDWSMRTGNNHSKISRYRQITEKEGLAIGAKQKN